MMTALPIFTEDAQSDLERYLGRVNSALRPHPSVDADDVEREIRGHIEAELEGASAPVTAERLRGVLDRLGSPGDWVPTDELPAWRKLLLQLSSGREDWRLAYLTLGLFLGCPLLGSAAPLAFFASILIARAGAALIEERSEPVGARKWLLYPPLVFIYVALAIVAVILPPVLLGGLAADPELPPELHATRDFLFGWLPAPYWLGATLLVTLAAGTWWLGLGLALARFRRAVRWVFWPFADWFERRHGLRIALVGLTTAVVSGIALAVVL